MQLGRWALRVPQTLREVERVERLLSGSTRCPDDPEGEDVRAVSVGHLSVVYARGPPGPFPARRAGAGARATSDLRCHTVLVGMSTKLG